MLPVFIGWDPREVAAWQVCARSMLDHASVPLDIRPVMDPHLRATGVYWRRWRRVNGYRVDVNDNRYYSLNIRLPRLAVFSLLGLVYLIVDVVICLVHADSPLLNLLNRKRGAKASDVGCATILMDGGDLQIPIRSNGGNEVR